MFHIDAFPSSSRLLFCCFQLFSAVFSLRNRSLFGIRPSKAVKSCLEAAFDTFGQLNAEKRPVSQPAFHCFLLFSAVFLCFLEAGLAAVLVGSGQYDTLGAKKCALRTSERSGHFHMVIRSSWFWPESYFPLFSAVFLLFLLFRPESAATQVSWNWPKVTECHF